MSRAALFFSSLADRFYRHALRLLKRVCGGGPAKPEFFGSWPDLRGPNGWLKGCQKLLYYTEIDSVPRGLLFPEMVSPWVRVISAIATVLFFGRLV